MTELNEKAIEAAARALADRLEKAMDVKFAISGFVEDASAAVSAYLSALPAQEPELEQARYTMNNGKWSNWITDWGGLPWAYEPIPGLSEHYGLFASTIAHPLRDEEVERLTRERDACQKQAVNYEMITRLMEAVEGECDGLAIDAGQALAILSHVMGAEVAEAKLAALQPDQNKCEGADDPEERCPRHPRDCKCWQVDFNHPTMARQPDQSKLDRQKAADAAVKANHAYGQWMPEQWLHLFLDAYEGKR